MNKDKLIKNEQIFRDRNKSISSALQRYFGGQKNVADAPLEFVCECSDPDCTDPIIVTISEYEKLHKRNDRFLIVKGHKSPEVEKTVKNIGKLELVEKPELAA
jgi:hypothetical protein